MRKGELKRDIEKIGNLIKRLTILNRQARLSVTSPEMKNIYRTLQQSRMHNIANAVLVHSQNVSAELSRLTDSLEVAKNLLLVRLSKGDDEI